MKNIEDRLKEIRSELDDLESDVQDLWDAYIEASEERDGLEEKLAEVAE